MGNEIPELNLPVQGFVLGSAVGMLVAAIRFHLTGDLERWSLIVGYFALIGMGAGVVWAVIGGVS